MDRLEKVNTIKGGNTFSLVNYFLECSTSSLKEKLFLFQTSRAYHKDLEVALYNNNYYCYCNA